MKKDNKMVKLNLRVRYFQDSTPPGVPCIEKNFKRREIVMPLSIEQTALILVDIWNGHYIKSWMERAKEVTIKAIVPVIDASDEDIFPTPRVYDWPPEDFVKRKGDYKIFDTARHQPPGLHEKMRELKLPPLDLSEDIEIRPDDYMIRNGNQLHRLFYLEMGRQSQDIICISF